MRARWLIATATTASFLIGAGNIPATQAQTPSPPPTGFHLLETTIDDVHSALQSRQTTCRALVELYFKRIQAYDKSGPSLNAIQVVNPRALQEADRLDTAFRSSGPVGALHCIPVLIKDQIDTNDMPTTYGSALFRDFVPPADATIVNKLKRAGAVVVGKATMGEYALRTTRPPDSSAP